MYTRIRQFLNDDLPKAIASTTTKVSKAVEPYLPSNNLVADINYVAAGLLVASYFFDKPNPALLPYMTALALHLLETQLAVADPTHADYLDATLLSAGFNGARASLMTVNLMLDTPSISNAMETLSVLVNYGNMLRNISILEKMKNAPTFFKPKDDAATTASSRLTADKTDLEDQRRCVV